MTSNREKKGKSISLQSVEYCWIATLQQTQKKETKINNNKKTTTTTTTIDVNSAQLRAHIVRLNVVPGLH